MTPVPHEMNKRNQWNTSTSPMAWGVLPTAHRRRPRWTTSHTPGSLGGTAFHLGTAWTLRGHHQCTRKTPAKGTHQHQGGSARRVRAQARHEMDINVAGTYCKFYSVPFIVSPNTVDSSHRKCASAETSLDNCRAQEHDKRGALYLKNPRASNHIKMTVRGAPHLLDTECWCLRSIHYDLSHKQNLSSEVDCK